MIVLICANGRTLGRIVKIERCQSRDLLPADCYRWGSPDPMVGLSLSLARAIACPDAPDFRTKWITIWAEPSERFDTHDRPLHRR